MILHTLIIPTRNRPDYLSVGIAAYLSASCERIELIVADASDATTINADTVSRFSSDPRFIYLNNCGQNLSMAANWETGIKIARGRWVSVVGDDDVLDPSLVDCLTWLDANQPDIKAVSWPFANFDVGLSHPRPGKIPMAKPVANILDAKASLQKNITWMNANRPPATLCSIYHGAVKQEVLTALSAERQGRVFAFVTVDYDLGWSIGRILDRTLHVEKPFSVSGHSPKSNSLAVRSFSAREERARQWIHEARYLDGWGEVSDPFFFTLPLVVLGFLQAFKAKYHIQVSLNMQNLVNTMVWDCRTQADEASFQWYKTNLLQFLKKHFNLAVPEDGIAWLPIPEHPFFGLSGDILSVDTKAVQGDLGRFADLVFGSTPDWRYCIGSAANGGKA